MQKLNDSMNHPLRFILEGKTLGQFYNSWDKKFHLAEYVPYKTLPQRYMCGKTGNFALSRNEYEKRNICEECFNHIKGK